MSVAFVVEYSTIIIRFFVTFQ